MSWNAVTDKMPDDEEFVLVVEFEYSNPKQSFVWMCYYNKYCKVWRDNDGNTFYHVTHWMPLPQIPEFN